jgi:hypothetical protein
MNELVVSWCRGQKVEDAIPCLQEERLGFRQQKNGTVFRRLMGYGHFDRIENGRLAAYVRRGLGDRALRPSCTRLLPTDTDVAGPTSLAGQLLVAEPDRQSPPFDRTVVLVAQHNQEGAVSIIINQPGDRRPIAELLARRRCDRRFGSAAVSATHELTRAAPPGAAIIVSKPLASAAAKPSSMRNVGTPANGARRCKVAAAAFFNLPKEEPCDRFGGRRSGRRLLPKHAMLTRGASASGTRAPTQRSQ